MPLWFGAFKNANSSYAPSWVKLDPVRFPRACAAPGVSLTPLTAFSPEVLRCDARAFAAFMRHLKTVDETHRTVVMVQVENEVGLLWAPRDRSPLADAAFAAPVPAELMDRLDRMRERLRPELRECWEASGAPRGGNWSDVFGIMTDEAFMAWHFARFVEGVAAAGSAEYPLPCFANAWLVQHDCERPGEYPSGGPVSRVRDIWRAAAPTIQVLAPDIYLPEFTQVCADYTAGGEPLLIPEARRDVHAAARAWYAFGRHDALAYSPFGLETVGQPGADCGPAEAALLGSSYRLLRELLPQVDGCLAAQRSVGILQDARGVQSFHLGGYRVRVSFVRPYNPSQAAAGGLIASPADGEFVVAGFGFGVDFAPPLGQPNGYVDALEIWEGSYAGGGWKPGRRLNGDEWSVRLGWEPGVQRVKVYTFR